jgi:hypothetical protein
MKPTAVSLAIALFRGSAPLTVPIAAAAAALFSIPRRENLDSVTIVHLSLLSTRRRGR